VEVQAGAPLGANGITHERKRDTMNANDAHIFTPRLSDGSRAELSLSEDDYAKIKRGRDWTAVVTDQRTGATYAVAGAECGLPDCFCDAVVVDVS
jgi:hypothetical protein